MRPPKLLKVVCILLLLTVFLAPPRPAQADPTARFLPRPAGAVTPSDLILAMNTLRVSYGLPALIEDPIINAVAQVTAETMAANQMSWHIGDVRGRLAAAGYGGGATVWATENFAVGFDSIDLIMQAWSDPDHMRPAVNPVYCHVGAGVAKAPNGQNYYILQAAYTSDKACGPYKPPEGSAPGTPFVGGIIIPVKIATPDPEGKIWHEVKSGQSFWAIAIAYKITIKDLLYWNNLPETYKLQIGDKLFIPGSNTAGYATPTPVGMVVRATPNEAGETIHTVQVYQTLITIAEAYSVTVDLLLSANGLQVDWPLQIGQKLFIPSGQGTPSPLDPLQRLTPASDGKYYHVVKPGESLSRIADIYKISVNQLMLWNGLNGASVIQPDQKLLLMVTPPPSATPTPAPPTGTPSPLPPSPTATRTPTRPFPSPTATALPAPATAWPVVRWAALALVAAAGLAGLGLILRKSGNREG